ncbi:MAG: hypothetical protein ABI869_05070 [Actinomycetota bacterium]
MKRAMPWSVKRDQSVVRVEIRAPMEAEWEALLRAVEAQLEPVPLAVYIPARIPSASETDAEMLRLLWQTVGSRGVPIMPG